MTGIVMVVQPLVILAGSAEIQNPWKVSAENVDVVYFPSLAPGFQHSLLE